MKIKSFLLAALILLVLVSCSKEVKVPYGIFNVDSSAIGNQIIMDSLQVEFHPPLNWQISETELTNKKVIDYHGSRRNPDDYKFVPAKIFFDKTNRSVLNVGKVVVSKDDLTKDEAIKSIVEISTSRYPTVEKTYDNFEINGLEFTRVRFDYANWSASKIFLQNKNGEILQFEYTAQKDLMPTQNPLIEASIGTIKFR